MGSNDLCLLHCSHIYNSFLAPCLITSLCCNIPAKAKIQSRKEKLISHLDVCYGFGSFPPESMCWRLSGVEAVRSLGSGGSLEGIRSWGHCYRSCVVGSVPTRMVALHKPDTSLNPSSLCSRCSRCCDVICPETLIGAEMSVSYLSTSRTIRWINILFNDVFTYQMLFTAIQSMTIY